MLSKETASSSNATAVAASPIAAATTPASANDSPSLAASPAVDTAKHSQRDGRGGGNGDAEAFFAEGWEDELSMEDLPSLSGAQEGAQQAMYGSDGGESASAEVPGRQAPAEESGEAAPSTTAKEVAAAPTYANNSCRGSAVAEVGDNGGGEEDKAEEEVKEGMADEPDGESEVVETTAETPPGSAASSRASSIASFEGLKSPGTAPSPPSEAKDSERRQAKGNAETKNEGSRDNSVNAATLPPAPTKQAELSPPRSPSSSPDAKGRMEQLEAAITHYKTKINELEGIVSQRERQLTSITEQYSVATSEAEGLKDKVRQLSSAIGAMRAFLIPS